MESIPANIFYKILQYITINNNIINNNNHDILSISCVCKKLALLCGDDFWREMCTNKFLLWGDGGKLNSISNSMYLFIYFSFSLFLFFTLSFLFISFFLSLSLYISFSLCLCFSVFFSLSLINFYPLSFCIISN